jgi:hypothetical protein
LVSKSTSQFLTGQLIFRIRIFVLIWCAEKMDRNDRPMDVCFVIPFPLTDSADFPPDQVLLRHRVSGLQSHSILSTSLRLISHSQVRSMAVKVIPIFMLDGLVTLCLIGAAGTIRDESFCVGWFIILC